MGREIFVGSLANPTFHWTNESIMSLSVYTAVDFACDELVADECHITVKSNASLSIAKGTPIYYVVDGNTSNLFYCESVERVETNDYEVNGISAIGLLEDMEYLGGKFTAGTDTFNTVLSGIMSGSNISYQVLDASLGNQPVDGYLPISSKREALHSLLMAFNATLTKDANGGIVLAYLYDYTGTAIPPSRMRINGTLKHESPASIVQVTEHTYMQTSNDEEVVLYDSAVEGTADNTFVKFSQYPIHSLTYPSTMTIGANNCNYAVVSGTGQLKGKKYTHSTRIVSKTNSSAPTQNIKQVSGNPLIGTLNSQAVLEKLYAYYTTSERIHISIYRSGESAGRKVNFVNPFGDNASGFISEMNLVVDGDELASCKVVSGYTPTGQGSSFTNAMIVDSGSSFSIPATKIKAILIGGGNGGGGGYNGSAATRTAYSGDSRPSIVSYGSGGNGGNGGTGGTSGKIKIVDLDNLTVGANATISLGVGGNGGNAEGGTGSSGTHTTMKIGQTTYSSNDGEIMPNGFVNIFNGQIYGKTGTNGIAGGKGGGYVNSVFVDPEDVIYRSTVYSGGNSFEQWSYYEDGLTGYGTKGGGSGACGGHNGNAGADQTADGGNGVNADTPLQANYGSGGNGGNGGSGGGTNSVAYYSYGISWWQEGNVGLGGNGSPGGKGGNGAIIIYY